jgi:hypothetical protein
MADVCAHCLERKLKGCLGRKVIVENHKKQTIGRLSGFRVQGRDLRVIVQKGRHFHVIENATRISFQDQSCEEIKLIE